MVSDIGEVVKRRNADLTYNLPTFIELPGDAVGFDWAGRLAALGSSPQAVAELVVRQPDYLAASASLCSSEDLDDGKPWARWRVIHARAPWLPDALVAGDFVFYGRRLHRRRADHQGRLSDEVAVLLEAGNRPRRPRRQLPTRLRSHYDRELAKLGDPVDHDERFMTAQTVNAYNSGKTLTPPLRRTDGKA